MSTTTCTESSPILVGFGKNYYHNFGPAQPSELIHVRDKDDDEINNASSTTTSSSKTHPLTYVPSYQFLHQTQNDAGEEEKQQQQSPPTTPWDQEDDPVIDVKCTIASTHFLTRTGKIYICGTIHGQVKPSLTRITIPLPLKCVELATGRHFCLARMEGGLAVCAWGAGHFGQLGLGGGYDDNYTDGSNRSSSSSSSSSPPSFVHRPTVIDYLLPHMVGAPISSITAGYWHSMALTKEGTVFAWGCNRNAQCGKKPSSKDPPTVCHPRCVSFDETGAAMGSSKKIKISKIVAGRSHSVALDEGGQCYTWGANQYGQCGILSRRRIGGVAAPKHVEALAKVRIVDISAGDVHTLALTGGGRVFGWGGGFEGQLGTGFIYQMNPKPKLVSDLDFVAIEAGQEAKAKQKEKSTANGGSARTTNLDNTPRIVSVTAKGNSSFAVSSTGHVYAWGCNDVGNLGLPKPDPSTLTYSDPGQIGSKATSIQRQFQTYSFDSSHNIALPQRLDSLRDYHIKCVGASSTFMWCLGTKRQDHRGPIGRTLYEVQETKRKKSPRGQHETKNSAAFASGESDSRRERSPKQGAQTTKNHPEKGKSSEVGVTGWTRAKNLPPKAEGRSKANTTPTSSSRDLSRSHDWSSSFRADQEEPSQAFSTTSVPDKRSSASTPGKKKRLFSPKKLVQAIVRRASGSYKTDQASLPTVDIVGGSQESPKHK